MKYSNVQDVREISIGALKEFALRRQSALLIVFVISAIIAGDIVYFFEYQKSQEKLKVLGSQQEGAKTEDARLTDAIGRLMVLPHGESPTIATVTDKDRLKTQPFFAQAENGDKVLIYSKAKKAILFRPSINKIIDVTSIAIASPSAQASPSATPTSRPTFSLPTSIPQVSPSSDN